MKRFITQFSRLNNQNVTATADADANHDNRATVEPLRIRSARAAAAFPRLSTVHNARAKRTAAEIRADLTSWSNAGPRDELRRDAADMINGCLQRNDDTLYLSYLGLSSLPNSICELVHLKELTVDHNNLSEIPGEIEKLKNLERVDFSSNKIVQLPENIGALKKLKSIKVSDNRISSLPQNIGGIEILLNFQIDSNRVSQLPSTIYGLGSGAIVFTHNNPISTTDRFIIAAQMRRSDYKGPVIFQKGSEPRKGRAYEPDPFSTMTDLEKIETLLASAEEMSDGRYEAPVNFCMGGRNMNKKECLLMALEISLDSHRELAPSISYRLLNDLPSDTKEFLVNSVTFDRERIQSWSTNEALPLQIKVAREVIEVESSLLESGPQYDYAQDQNVHDERVHANFVRQSFLIENQVENPKIPHQANQEISLMIDELQPYLAERIGDAKAGLALVMGREDIARGFTKSPADTLALLWTYIGSTDLDTASNLKNALVNRLAEIGSGHICGLGITERIIDIPTAVDWTITNSISFEHLHTEIAKMAGDVNDEFEEKFGDQADVERNLAIRSGNSLSQGDTEQRINEIKRDMFIAKARVELISLRNLDEGLVTREIGKIFDAAAMRDRI